MTTLYSPVEAWLWLNHPAMPREETNMLAAKMSALYTGDASETAIAALFAKVTEGSSVDAVTKSKSDEDVHREYLAAVAQWEKQQGKKAPAEVRIQLERQVKDLAQLDGTWTPPATKPLTEQQQRDAKVKSITAEDLQARFPAYKVHEISAVERLQLTRKLEAEWAAKRAYVPTAEESHLAGKRARNETLQPAERLKLARLDAKMGK